MSNSVICTLNPFGDYQHIINDIKMRGGLKYIKAYLVSSDVNLPDAKRIIFGCMEGKITLTANSVADGYMDMYIQGVFAELKTECKKYDRWHYKRVREN